MPGIFGADLAAWHFLTGPPAQVEPVIAAWGMWVKSGPDRRPRPPVADLSARSPWPPARDLQPRIPQAEIRPPGRASIAPGKLRKLSLAASEHFCLLPTAYCLLPTLLISKTA